jgi:LCP family protein required for cell wall assembly
VVKLRRTWPQRLLIGFNSCLVVVCLSSAWTLAYYQRQISSIRRVPLQGVLDRQDDPSKSVNFLLVGSDSTGNNDPNAPENADRFGTYHADSISILRVDPVTRDVSLLSLPRDLWVTIPGRSGVHKINAALTYASPPGDPKLLIQTIQESFHIPIHHYVKVDFAAFRSLVDELDGVNLWFDRPARDEQIGLFVDEAGCRLANGEEALAFARSRHYKQRADNGTWPEDPTNDVGRIARQQYFLKQAAKKAIARGARNPVELSNLIGITQRYVDIDDVLTPHMILDIVANFNAFDPDDLEVSQPYTVRHVRPGPGGDGQDLLVADSEPIFARFREPVPDEVTTTTTAPARGGSVPATVPPPPPPPPDQLSFVPHTPPGVAC